MNFNSFNDIGGNGNGGLFYSSYSGSSSGAMHGGNFDRLTASSTRNLGDIFTSFTSVTSKPAAAQVSPPLAGGLSAGLPPFANGGHRRSGEEVILGGDIWLSDEEENSAPRPRLPLFSRCPLTNRAQMEHTPPGHQTYTSSGGKMKSVSLSPLKNLTIGTSPLKTRNNNINNQHQQNYHHHHTTTARQNGFMSPIKARTNLESLLNLSAGSGHHGVPSPARRMRNLSPSSPRIPLLTFATSQQQQQQQLQASAVNSVARSLNNSFNILNSSNNSLHFGLDLDLNSMLVTNLTSINNTINSYANTMNSNSNYEASKFSYSQMAKKPADIMHSCTSAGSLDALRRPEPIPLPPAGGHGCGGSSTSSLTSSGSPPSPPSSFSGDLNSMGTPTSSGKASKNSVTVKPSLDDVKDDSLVALTNKHGKGKYWFKSGSPTPDPRWPACQQLMIGPIPGDIEYSTLRSAFLSKGHTIHLFIQNNQAWLEKNQEKFGKKQVKFGYVVYTDAEVARKLLSNGHVMVGHAKVAVKEMDGQPAQFVN